MWSRIGKWGTKFLAGEIARIWVWPILPSIGIGLIGWVQDVQWFYLLVGSGVMFAAIPTGLVRFAEWKYRTIVQDKIVFNKVRVSKILANDGSVRALRLGFQLNSSAMFPVAFRVSELATQLMEYFPPKKRYEQDKVIIPPQGFGWFDDQGLTPRRKLGVWCKSTVLSSEGHYGHTLQRPPYGTAVDGAR